MFNRKKSISALKIELKQKKILELLDGMLMSNTDIHFSPTSDEYFILDRDKQVFLLLSGSSIKICNHKYRYEIALSGREVIIFTNRIRKSISSRCTNIKKELFSNEISLIDQIKDLYNE